MVAQKVAARKSEGGRQRLQDFRAALVRDGATMTRWAEAHGISYGHLRFVLLGERTSPRLEPEIDAVLAGHHVHAA